MKQANLTDLRRNLSSIMNAVNADHEPLIVTRRRGKPVVMMSLEDYQAMGAPVQPEASADTSDQLLQSFFDADDIYFVPNAVEASDLVDSD